jgi:Fe-S-cluster containining protein
MILPPAADVLLVQIVDAALADAARRSGEWLVCRPGCTQCCVGVFSIHQLDVARLQEGLQDLHEKDGPRAARLRARATASVERLRKDFPGDSETGILDDSEEASLLFEDFANDETCAALDPETGRCDLYAARPMTCRVFGPPVRSEQGLGVCELCYHGASEEQIAACEMVADADGLEDRLVQEYEETSGKRGRTVVAFALLASPPERSEDGP